MTAISAPRTVPVEYPERDGRPMGESDEHRDEMKDYGIDVLKDHFARERRVYVSGNNFIYYTKGVPADCVSPDVYVVRGVAQRQRNVYKVWEEGGRVPCFALEVTSKSTRREDLGDKMARYRDELQVADYFLFDLWGEWIPERLRGFRLAAGVYQPLAVLASGRLASRELSLELGVLDGHVRFFRPGEDEPLPTRGEQAQLYRQRAEQERARAERERKRAERAERELARLRRAGRPRKGRTPRRRP